MFRGMMWYSQFYLRCTVVQSPFDVIDVTYTILKIEPFYPSSANYIMSFHFTLPFAYCRQTHFPFAMGIRCVCTQDDLKSDSTVGRGTTEKYANK